MSNCIEIHSNRLELPGTLFNIPAFKEWFDRQVDKDESGMSTGFYWFLKRNTDIEEDKVTIRVGQGHSSHTWRDFKWVVWTLNQFFTANYRHVFQIADEMDGFDLVEGVEVSWPYEKPEDMF